MDEDRLEQTLQELERALGRSNAPGSGATKRRHIVRLTEDMIVESPRKGLSPKMPSGQEGRTPPAKEQQLEDLVRRMAEEAAHKVMEARTPELLRAFAEALATELGRELGPAMERACARAFVRALAKVHASGEKKR